jgi:Icc protein
LLRCTLAALRRATGALRVLIAQISDMHVSKPGKLFGKRCETRAAFERAIARVLSMSPQADLVLLSGDLAKTGDPEEYDFIAAQLARLSCPVLAIPGNHDVREEMLRKLPQCVAAQEGGHLSFAYDDLPLRIIGLDTIIPGAVNGEICERRLEWLEQTLAAGAGKPTLIAMHHPPIKTGFVAMDNYGIRSGTDAFARIAAKHAADIRMIVCGHVHRTIVGTLGGIPVLIAPASSLAFKLDLGEKPSLHFVEEPQQFLVHAWSEATGLVSHAAFVDDFPGPFALG